MLVRATAFIDATTHVTLRPPVAETGSWTLVLDGGPRGGELVLMFAHPDAQRLLKALVDGLRAGDTR
ncbi:MAG: hypothetical protein ACRDQ0_07555 [Pseudonocardia sp.]